MNTVTPNITFRLKLQQDQKLSYLQGDTNFGSLLHTASFTVSGSHEESYKNAEFVSFSYAPYYTVQSDPGSEVQAEPIVFKVRESAEDIGRKLGGEKIFGDLYVDGTLYAHNSIVESSSMYIQSDARLKENVHPFYNSLDRATQITPVNFTWKPEAERSGADVGVIAQEVQLVYPDAVSEGSDGYLRVDYIKLVPLLLGAVKELSARIDQLEHKQ